LISHVHHLLRDAEGYPTEEQQCPSIIYFMLPTSLDLAFMKGKRFPEL
jgi:hypothetical protein